MLKEHSLDKAVWEQFRNILAWRSDSLATLSSKLFFATPGWRPPEGSGGYVRHAYSAVAKCPDSGRQPEGDFRPEFHSALALQGAHCLGIRNLW